MRVTHITRIARVSRLNRSTLRAAACLPLLALFTACGAWQSIKDTSADTTRAVFIAKVKQMNLVIASRSALNQDGRGVSLPVVLRIYQLKDSKVFETATYSQLLAGTGDALKAGILAKAEVTLAPSASVRLSERMADDTQYVGVVAFFRSPVNAEWQLVIPKTQWKKTDPVTISVIDNRLEIESAR
jgi:type VI secretion system protein VasD